MVTKPIDLLIAANRAQLAGFHALAKALIELWHKETKGERAKQP